MAVTDLTQYQSWPFATMGTARELEPPVDLEPPRKGEGGVDCFRCDDPYDGAVWNDDRWC